MARASAGVLLAFFLSGTSALIYEVLWTRMLGWAFGTTTYAISTSVTAFMAGLALGSWMGGRLSERFADPLRFYVILEALTGGLGIGLTLALPHLEPLAVLLDPLGLPGRFLCLFGLLLVPTTMMGATLPTLVLYLNSLESSLGAVTARLYAINTLGAVSGALATDFLLVPALGLSGTGLLAGLLNLAAAAIVLGVRRPAMAAAPQDRGLPPPLWLLAAFGLSGFAALAYEVLWTRVLLFLIGSEIYAFSLILSVFLAGLAAGAALMGRRVDALARPGPVLGGLQCLLGMLGLASLWAGSRFEDLKPLLADAVHSGWAIYLASGVAACVVVMLPATLLMGATVPLFLKLGAGDGLVGRSVGVLYATNTLGSSLGAVAAGFVLLPALGLQRSLIATAGLNALLAVLFLRTSRLAPAVGLLAALALGAAATVPRDALLAGACERRFGPLRYFRDGIESTIAVAMPEEFDGQRYPRLVVNGFSMTGLSFKSQRYMKLLGHLPALLAERPRRALVICLGTGMTLSAVAQHQELEVIDCVELDHGVREALPQFSSLNREVWKDPRVRIHIDDGRHWLLTRSDTYDLITFEPPPPHNAGVVNLYSRDYYELCRARLSPGGLVCQWLPVHQMTPEETRSCIRAFLDVFPEATLWSNFAYTDLCLLGGAQPLKLDPRRLRERLAPLQPQLAAIGVPDAESLLVTFLHGPEHLRAYTRKTRPLTDDRPLMQYSLPLTVDVDLDWLLARREPVQAYTSGALKLESAYRINDSIYQLYIHELHQPEAWWKRELLAQTVADLDPANPYAQFAFRVTDSVKPLLDRRVDSGDLPALVWRARWLRWRGRTDEARRDLQRYLEREPASAQAWLVLGTLCSGPEAKRVCFSRGLEAGTRDPELHRLLEERVARWR